MPLLQQRLADSATQLCFLVEFATLSTLDMKLNTKTIQWFKRMPSIFEEHQQIVSKMTEQYQSGLKVCVFLFQCILMFNVEKTYRWLKYKDIFPYPRSSCTVSTCCKNWTATVNKWRSLRPFVRQPISAST